MIFFIDNEMSAQSGSFWWGSALMVLMIFRPQGIFGDSGGDALDAR